MVAFVLVVEGPLALPKLSLSLPPKELVVVFSVPLLLLQSVVVVEDLQGEEEVHGVVEADIRKTLCKKILLI